MSARILTPLLVTAFLCLMGGAWLMATPPGASFDEGAHYVKAIAAGRGELYGSKPQVSLANLRELYRLGAGDPSKFGQLDSALKARAVRWQSRTRRRFEVPPNLIDSRFGCTRYDKRAPATCVSLDAVEPGVVSASMQRPATVERGDWQSWGGVTRAELEALAATGCLELEGELTAYPPERWMWSLVYRGVH